MATKKAEPSGEPVNTVELAGRVSGDPEARTLPSGDELVTLRLVVARPAGGPVDTIDLACWSGAARRAAGRVGDGDHVHVTGALRRRFFRTPGGAASRYEVEVGKLSRQRVSA
ncbi:single-stranded DNA-binding protein [Knoellia subterranea]|uniref:Single-stranded DNA-binding protein n=1 Tax=Knoellia subterranea KCTC 19937 TaxID=1385521 RepID=A0A0A0JMK8_9MICO|nr:single-stranded DNA-binding protein [Knoellia subterranea]KGN38655.1 single-stranded DNA-binding protein [Knoellia subterranea KCTC 19937]